MAVQKIAFRPVIVTISRTHQQRPFPDTWFYCNTQGWQPIRGHGRGKERVEYITNRYNHAVDMALQRYPASHVLICDSYYLYQPGLARLISDYNGSGVVGASIWFREKTGLRSRIHYYDTMSVSEWKEKTWRQKESLPTGLQQVSAVGACWIFPASQWYGFKELEGEMVTSRCLGIQTPVLLDCDARLWRDHSTNPDIVENNLAKRLFVSASRVWRKAFKQRLDLEKSL